MPASTHVIKHLCLCTSYCTLQSPFKMQLPLQTSYSGSMTNDFGEIDMLEKLLLSMGPLFSVRQKKDIRLFRMLVEPKREVIECEFLDLSGVHIKSRLCPNLSFRFFWHQFFSPSRAEHNYVSSSSRCPREVIFFLFRRQPVSSFMFQKCS